VGFVPARSGSKRIPGKNTRPLHGHPLLAYTIAAALDSGVFDSVILSTDSDEAAEIGVHYGADVPFLRPAQYAADGSPDFDWLHYTVGQLAAAGRSWDSFSILRPTSPFRKADTIRRAWEQFTSDTTAHSLRAVELCSQHPGKMWVVDGNRMRPLLASPENGTPWHSSPYQSLPPVYAQNASLEIAWTKTLLEQRSIAGTLIMPFFTTGSEGLDVNEPRDWWYVEELLRRGEVELPTIAAKPWPARKAGRGKREGGRGRRSK
jgi:CMP-N,N'-diacetyllegionaminic acid synthase